MIRNHVIMIASFSAIFGIIMGVSGMSIVWMQTTSNFSRIGFDARTEVGIVSKVELLEKLRSGHYTDATRQIEASLDNDLVNAGDLARSGAALSPSMLKAVEREREARAASGYEPSNATVNAAVQETFRLMPHADARTHASPIALEEGTH